MKQLNFPKVGVGVFIKKDGKILMVKRKGAHGQGTWSIPGGHLDWFETPGECAIREAYEETGVKTKNPRFSGITNDLFHKEDKHYITIFMEVDYVSGKPRVSPEEKDKVEEVNWFAEDKLPSPLFIPLDNFLSGRTVK